jgi:phage terminase small subunit
MRGGQNRKHPNLRVLEGNPGKRAIPAVPEPDAPAPLTPPVALDDDARAFWDATAPLLIERGDLTMVNRYVYASACAWWAQSQREGIGHKQRTAAYTIALRVLRDFGMTPASRIALAKKVPTAPGQKWGAAL